MLTTLCRLCQFVCQSTITISEQTENTTHQLRDVGHLSHVVQCVFSGFSQHDEAGGHDAEVPERLHVGLHVTVAVCWSEHQRVIKEVYAYVVL